jgi:PAS domain S-box-containing protein
MSLRILLVDDDQVDRMAVRRALRSAGVEAEIAEEESVHGALEAIRSASWDAVFLDFNLPGGDGLHVLREARKLGFTSPIIVLTGQSDDGTAAELMKSGATDYLSKGALTAERLEKTLGAALRVHHAETQAREAERALRESEARFRVLHETSPDGFMILRAVRDGSGEMVDAVWEYLNPAAERMSGRSASGLIGRRLLEEMPGVARSGLFQLYQEVVETGETRQVEVHYTEDPFDMWLRITAARLDEGFAVSFSDISPRKRAEEERELALGARNRFFAAMSHEIRTPMNAILGYTDLLLLGAYGPLSPQQTEGIERTYRAAKHLLELVNDVLDLSKLEAGKVDLLAESVSLVALVEELLATLEPLAAERGTELRLEWAGEDRPIRTDPRRVRQILLNLISNALKFGGGEPVTVQGSIPQRGGFEIRVRDRGPGIAANDLSRIFEEFVQLGSSEERGTGLGLPISKRLAEILGGTLEVESTIGEGSTFTLWLPDEMPREAAAESLPAAAAR